MPLRPSASQRDDLVHYTHKLLIAVAIAAVALILFRWLHVFVLAFGAALVAVLLRSVADPIRRRTRLDPAWSLGVAVVGLVAIIATVVWFVGEQVSMQLSQFVDALPGAWAAAQRELSTVAGGRWLLDRMHEAGGLGVSSFGPLAGHIGRLTGSGLGALADSVVVIIAGVYVAAQPRLYRDGLLALFPAAVRGAVTEAVDDSGVALRKWLMGTGLAMLAMGVLTTTGTALLGLPAPLALGLLSGVAEFVPIVGAIVSAVPGLLLAATQGPELVLWTLLFYIAAHQFEGHVLIPLIQRKVVAVPPALTVFSVLAFGVLFGPLGVVFATPLAVVVIVMVRRLYLRENGPAQPEATAAREG